MARITSSKIEKLIYLIRGQKVMLDSDLAELYEVETRILNRNVQRNITRFPDEFMFQLSSEEFSVLKSQIGISNKGRGGRRRLPYVFTEHGVAMLSAVLNSDKAIATSISIMKTFVQMRKVLASNRSLADRLEWFEKDSNKLFRIVFERLERLESKTPSLDENRKKIGL